MLCNILPSLYGSISVFILELVYAFLFPKIMPIGIVIDARIMIVIIIEPIMIVLFLLNSYFPTLIVPLPSTELFSSACGSVFFFYLFFLISS